MGDTFATGKVSVAGVATFGVGEAPGYSTIELAAQATRMAMADAGVSLPQVDGLFICLPDDLFSALSLAQYLGIHPRFTDNNRNGGSSFLSHLVTACAMLDAGYLDCAVIAYGSNQRSSGGKLATPAGADRWDAPYRPRYPVSLYALAAARHMHRYGTTREQLAEVAVAARQWANTNPEAFAQGPLTVEDILATRMISTPISVGDCCLVTDGAAALVLRRTEDARQGQDAPVPILGAAAATWYNSVTQAEDLTVTSARESGARALAMAGLTPADIDVVQLYDAFTINTILFLEDLGFCKKGEGGDFVSGGRIAPGGSLPVNTNGGGLSCCHPGMYGMFTMAEAIRQMRGIAANQIEGAETALAHANGGTLSAQATVVFGSPATV
ncbi:thiolase [Novosphingobium marinum]|uniref:Acetyl-CoA acetyltransferase n=1 Tax=Novosphingobium marinum TaxID=1514948 RepID=A0A7Y9XTV5_9SPHN|nr:acetyl-CoA acetyltransferase [Novosphingobium marinum]NYH94496.1 acetyl-CoA acetyltransferase [Novosphingobium marinum]GGC22774.1 thiolase [Novosphingobium marinum]